MSEEEPSASLCIPGTMPWPSRRSRKSGPGHYRCQRRRCAWSLPRELDCNCLEAFDMAPNGHPKLLHLVNVLQHVHLPADFRAMIQVSSLDLTGHCKG